MKKFAGSPVLFLSLLLTSWFAPLSFGQDLPAGTGRETLKKVCTQCHDIESVPRLRYSRADWTSLVYSMKDMGADATGAEMDEIIDYLTLNFGKGDDAAKKVNVNTAAAKDLETGLGITAKESDLIVQYRTKNGNFKDLAALLKVDGVDAAKVQAAKDKIAF
jgi:competence ComEA-like helix-hairpin-helix protein